MLGCKYFWRVNKRLCTCWRIFLSLPSYVNGKLWGMIQGAAIPFNPLPLFLPVFSEPHFTNLTCKYDPRRMCFCGNFFMYGRSQTVIQDVCRTHSAAVSQGKWAFWTDGLGLLRQRVPESPFQINCGHFCFFPPWFKFFVDLVLLGANKGDNLPASLNHYDKCSVTCSLKLTKRADIYGQMRTLGFNFSVCSVDLYCSPARDWMIIWLVSLQFLYSRLSSSPVSSIKPENWLIYSRCICVCFGCSTLFRIIETLGASHLTDLVRL